MERRSLITLTLLVSTIACVPAADDTKNQNPRDGGTPSPTRDAGSGSGTDATVTDGDTSAASDAGAPRDAMATFDAEPGSMDSGAADSGVSVGRRPIMIAAANYSSQRSRLQTHGPFMVYAWATNPALQNAQRYAQELDFLADIHDPGVEKWIMFSSYQTLAQKLGQTGHVAELKRIGVVGLGFNSEGGMTPTEEMNSLSSSDPSTNAVARFASIATAAGFRVLWGPIRATADSVSDGAVTAMFGAGLEGVGLQEQRFIESACVADRTRAVQATVARYRRLGGPSVHVNVQVMPSRCLTADTYRAQRCGSAANFPFEHCTEMLQEIGPLIDSVAIWASGGSDVSELSSLIETLRSNGI